MSARLGKKLRENLVEIRDQLMDADYKLDEEIIAVATVARPRVILKRAEAVRELVVEAMYAVDRLIDD